VRVILAATVVLAALVATSAASAVFVQFRTPTGTIGCGYDSTQGGSLRCDIGTGLRPKPPRPKGCHLDWGFGYVLATTGRAHVNCAGDTVIDPRARVLRYGSTWSRGGFSCASQPAGLRCENANAHGFFLSKQRSYRF
jgi:hypothetical protein